MGIDGQVTGAALADGAPTDAALRGELGGWTEVIAPVGAHHARLMGRVAPGWARSGFGQRHALTARLDVVLSGDHPLILSPYGRWRRGGTDGGWEAGLALSR